MKKITLLLSLICFSAFVVLNIPVSEESSTANPAKPTPSITVSVSNSEVGSNPDQDQYAMKPAWYRYFNPEEKSVSSHTQDLDQELIFAFLPSEKEEFIKFQLVNISDHTLDIRTQDGSLIMIQEAKNPQGNWQPIEYWDYDWGFGSVFSKLSLQAQEGIVVTAPKYKGNYPTQIRFKLKIGDEQSEQDIYYSEAFTGHINPNQFKQDPNSKDETVSYLEAR